MSESNPKVSVVSKPFIISAVIFVFAGSILGSIWMMFLLGAQDLGFARNSFSLHKTFQIDGFLTLLIMGIGYMIVPRFRNVQLPSSSLAYVSFILVIISIAISIISTFSTGHLTISLGSFAKFFGVSIFTGIMIWTLRIHPRLLRTADYFIGLSVVVLLAISLFHLILAVSTEVTGIGEPLGEAVRENGSLMSEVQMLMLFAILMIFGVEYKTLPSFLGFIKPRRKLSVVSFGLVVTSVILGLLSSMVYSNFFLAEIFNVALLGSVIAFSKTVYIFGGFDNKEILRVLQGERKARYNYTIRHLRLAFLFLFAGIVIAAAFSILGTFVLYDLAIHYIAIGFLGITIALYLPLMLPPITGRMIHFTKFNSLPLVLIICSLVIRTLGDIVLAFQPATIASVSYAFRTSGWLVVAALFVFVIMIHRSMKQEEVFNEQ
ncbi:MAG TPA: hypothetical protein VHF65_05710 [Nitrososphaera sp.]|nr:hypothetical protein [Nitrososphaera sp.]